MKKVIQVAIALSGLAMAGMLLTGRSFPEDSRLTITAATDAGSEQVRLHLSAREPIGTRLAILDGFRIVGYTAISADGTAEFTLAQLSPGQHWLRISITGRPGGYSAAVPVAIPASWKQENSSKRQLPAISLGGERQAPDGSETPARTISVDLNQDNIDDQVLLQPSSIAVALGDQHGGFQEIRVIPGDWSPFKFSGASSISDWNEDGFPDLALGAGGGILFCFGDGQGGVQSTKWVSGVRLPMGEAAGDLDGDGHADLVVLQMTGRGFTLAGLFGDGLGSMRLVPIQFTSEPLAPFVGNLEAGDRDGDGLIDFVQAGDVSPQRWRREADGLFHLDAGKSQTSAPLAASAARTAPTAPTERSATAWGTTAYGQRLLLAGGGANFLGNGIPATDAALGSMGQVLPDASQNFYFGHYSLVRKVTRSTGILTTVAGGGANYPGNGGAATAAALRSADFIARDGAGNLFVSEQNNNQVRKIDAATGLINVFAGTGTAGFGGDGQSATSAQLNSPYGLATDTAGNVYIADNGNHRIRRVSAATGKIDTVAGVGTFGFSGDGSAATAAQLYLPTGVRVDASGSLYIQDTGNARIRKVSAASGLISTVAGGGGSPYLSDGVPATSVSLSGAQAFSVDAAGSIYFVASGKLFKVTPAGVLKVALDPCCSVPVNDTAPDGLGNLLIAGTDHVSVLDLTSSSFTLSTNRVDVSGASGSGTVTVTTVAAGAPWTASSDMPWLQISPASGTGTATLTYSYAASTSIYTRSGKISVGGQTLDVYQAGATPNFSLSANSASLTALAVSGTVNLTVTPADAQWRIIGNPSWLTVTPSSGLGNAVLTYGVEVNWGKVPRTGSFSLIDNFTNTAASSAPFTVTQSVSASTVVSPSSGSASAAAGSLTVQLTTPQPLAPWSVSSDSAWLSVAPRSGSGDTLLTLSYAQNNTAKSRTALVWAGGQKFSLTQAGSAIPYSLWPTSWWGQMITIGGGGSADPGDGAAATSAQLTRPDGVVVDSAGSVFVAEELATRIRRIDPVNGLISTVSLGLNGYLGYPDGLALSSAGDLYFSNSYTSVYRLPGAGGAAGLVAGGGASLGDGGPATSALLSGAKGIALDLSGNLIIADAIAHRVRRVNLSTGIITTVAGTGTAGQTGDGGLAVNAELNSPFGVAVDAAGNLFIADTGNSLVREVSATTGLISVVAGRGSAGAGDGISAINSSLSAPYDLQFSPSGDLYIAEHSGSRIRRIDSATGLISTVAGNGTSTGAADGDSAIATAIGAPYRIAFDAVGNLYMTDTQSGKVRYVDYVSPRSTLSPYQLTVPVAAGTKSVQLTALASTGVWRLTNNTPSWLTVNPISGTGDTLIFLTYSANTSPSPRTATFTVRGQLFTLTQSGAAAMSLSRASLNLSALIGGATVTAPQVVSVTQSSPPPAAPWSVSADQPWCSVAPLTGAGSGDITVSVDAKSLPSTLTSLCRITVASPSANFPPMTILANLKQIAPAAAQPPFGAMDFPIDNSVYLTGEITVDGWALDDLGVKQVGIWRDPVGSEPAQPNGLVYIAAARFISGIRPDIEASYPAYPNSDRAAWSYSLAALPLLATGASTFKLHAIAVDEEGHSTELGTRTVTVASAASISGTISRSGVGLGGVTVTLSGALSPPVTTDANGNYGFSNLPPGYTYSVTPSKVGYVFTPPSVQYMNLVANQIANFTTTSSNLPAILALDRARLNFAAPDASTLSPAQKIVVSFGGGSAPWTASVNQSWLQVSPVSGTGPTRLTISINPAILPPSGTAIGTLTISAPSATPTSKNVTVYLTRLAAPSPPFGAFDTPANNATGVAGNIAVTGWALDDIGVKSVTLWRDPVGPEPTHANGYVYIADTLFIPDARPDVEASYPGSPQAYRAGWGYLMLTNGLPSASGLKGNGVFKLHAIATDEEGNQVNLGAKTITVDNLNSNKPFGTLDTPAPGQTISGTYLNWGWAMTPQPGAIAISGLGVWVGVDGVNFAHPGYGLKRADIASSFPGYANSDTGVGYYQLDTTRFSNGLHNLGWLIYDNLNRGDGIGSRFILIQNDVAAGSGDPEPALQAERDLHLRTARLQRPAAPVAGYPAYRQGYHLNAPLTPIRQAGGGLLEPIELKELDRLEIHLPGGHQWTAGLRVGDELRELPIGSTFDAEGGIFYWQLGPVFLGKYVLEFRATDGTVLPIPVHVGVGAAPPTRR